MSEKFPTFEDAPSDDTMESEVQEVEGGEEFAENVESLLSAGDEEEALEQIDNQIENDETLASQIEAETATLQENTERLNAELDAYEENADNLTSEEKEELVEHLDAVTDSCEFALRATLGVLGLTMASTPLLIQFMEQSNVEELLVTTTWSSVAIVALVSAIGAIARISANSRRE